jgi:hypothetical protein
MEIEQGDAQPLEGAQPAVHKSLVEEDLEQRYARFLQHLRILATESWSCEVTNGSGHQELFPSGMLHEQYVKWGDDVFLTLFPFGDGPYTVRRVRDVLDNLDEQRAKRQRQEQQYQEGAVRTKTGAKVKEPPPFSGKKPHTDVIVWLRSVISYFKLVAEPPERWVPVAESYLAGDALERWSALRTVEPTWQQFHDFLVLHFGDPFVEQETRRALSNLRVESPVNTRSVAQMGQELSVLLAKVARIRKAEVHTAEGISYFFSALERSGEAGIRLAADLELRREVYPEEFGELAKLIAVAARLAGEGIRSRGTVGPSAEPNQRKPESKGQGTYSRPKRFGKAPQELPSWRAEATYVGGQKNLKCIPHWLRKERVEKHLCLWCNASGHTIAACEKQEPVRPDPHSRERGQRAQKGPAGQGH